MASLWVTTHTAIPTTIGAIITPMGHSRHHCVKNNIEDIFPNLIVHD